jgi:hypothetical protein
MNHRTRRTLRGSLVTIGAAAALVTLASPAVAATGSGSSGSGTLTTDLTFVSHPTPADCATANNGFGDTTSFSSGTFTSGSASYTGPVTITWKVDQTTNNTWYEGPEATHGSSHSCSGGSTGDPWDITGTVSGTNSHGSTVSCTFSSGTYSRTNDVDIVVALDGTCDIHEHQPDGTDSVTGDATHVDLSQTLGACVVPNPMIPIPTSCATSGDTYSAS